MNAAMQTTAAPVKVTTGTSVKTMLQLKLLAPAKIVAWAWSFDGSAAATPGEIEIIETGTVFATVTAFVAADISPIDAEAVSFGDPTSAYISVGTSASGYTSTVEGSITTTRNLDFPQLGAPTVEFLEQFPLGQEAWLPVGKSVRIRVTFGAAINMLCGLKLQF